MKRMKIKFDENKAFRFKIYPSKRKTKSNSLNCIILLINSLIFFIIGLITGRFFLSKNNFSMVNDKIINSNNTNNNYNSTKINPNESPRQNINNINILTSNPIIYNNSKNITIGSQSINYISHAQQLEDLILLYWSK